MEGMMPWPGTGFTKKKTGKVAIFHARKTNASDGPCVFSVTEPITSYTAQRWPIQITATQNSLYRLPARFGNVPPCRVPRLGLGLGLLAGWDKLCGARGIDRGDDGPELADSRRKSPFN